MISIENSFKFHMNDRIVVGCSTGPDSMALVDMLLKIRDKYHLSIIICHVNHNVRKESAQEEQFLKMFCEFNHLIFESMTIEEYGDDNSIMRQEIFAISSLIQLFINMKHLT